VSGDVIYHVKICTNERCNEAHIPSYEGDCRKCGSPVVAKDVNLWKPENERDAVAVKNRHQYASAFFLALRDAINI